MPAPPPLRVASSEVPPLSALCSGLCLCLCVSLCFGPLPACRPDHVGGLGDGPGSPDMTAPPQPCTTSAQCEKDTQCYQGLCVPDLGTCCNDNDCENDTRCSVQMSEDGGAACGICLAWAPGGDDPTCQGQGFSAGAFVAPVDQCHWPAGTASDPNAQVVTTPLVIDIDGDGTPEIVFAPQANSGPERLVAMRSSDCSEIYNVAANLEGFSQIAAADLDGDKKPEIIGILAAGTPGTGHNIAVFNGQTGALLAQSDQVYTISGVGFDCSGPATADIDGDGTPEIVAAGMVVRYSAGKLTTLWNRAVAGGTWGAMSLINDMNNDGKMEVISGNKMFDGLTGADITPSVMSGLTIGGYPAIGDFNMDGFPDIVFIQSQSDNQRVAVIDVHNNAFLMPPTVVPGGWGGPPTVADFDGDGKPEFGTAGPRNYFVFSLDCLQDPRPAKCTGSSTGVLWQSNTKDVSSGGTASSVFDFNGDGHAKVVYRDECWLRVYNGPDGKTLFARSITSGTALEMPVVADVNGDGHADLIVPSDNLQGPTYCNDQSPEASTGQLHTAPTQGVFVMRDPMNRWTPSRAIWNEHTYHITNVNDDSTLPLQEAANWQSYNNYRQNVQQATGLPQPEGDSTGKIVVGLPQPGCPKYEILYGEICNRGSAPIDVGFPGTFYPQDPRKVPAAMPICTATTSMTLMPGQCQQVQCNQNNPPDTAQNLWFRVNDNGLTTGVFPECKGGNDVADLPAVSCSAVPG